ncbi:MAG TPA: hypothetical protein VLT88_14475 [Desulfosarcina sp.]|nr:hypothetical protein [Desulfosarcina sp.]
MPTQARLKACKRAALRTPTEAIVTCRLYASSGALQAADGIMRNFSSHGSYIETSRPFASGTILLMRMIRYPSAPSASLNDDCPRSICLAEVKWRRVLAEADAVRYGMGVRYLE